jgi:sugar O-acyltransferase (sialic acid O-acetyltransferase NeuD family)
LVRFELPSRLLVYGCRSRYAAEVAEILGRLEYSAVSYVDNMIDGPEIPDVGPVVSVGDLEPPGPGVGVIVPVFGPGNRKRVVDECSTRGYSAFPVLVDPKAAVAMSSVLGPGSLINTIAVVASNTAIGSFVSVNRSASIGHDNVIDDFVSLGPGCVLMGNATVGTGAFIGGGATVLPGVRIGENAIVGAGSVVTTDVPPRTVVLGNPARVVRPTAGYDEVGV